MNRTPASRICSALVAAGLALGVTVVASASPAAAATKPKVGVVVTDPANGGTLYGGTLYGGTLYGGTLYGGTLY
jgi:hypothetical protein